MIKVVMEDGRYYTRVFCDFCRKQIVDAKDGNAEHPMEGGEVFFTHKKCCWHWESANGGRAKWGTMELSAFVLRLGLNLEMEHEILEE